MKINFLLLVALLLSQLTFAQKYSFIGYSNNQGLPQSQVQCITQDNQGYLWVGTIGGLAYFNGKTFNTFPIENGLLNNRISCLNNVNGTIWVGHEGGISKIENGKAMHWQLSQEDRNINVTDILSFNGKIIAATEGGGVYQIDEKRVYKILLNNDDASTCRDLEVIGKWLYIATRDGVYKSNDIVNFTHVKSIGNRSISSIKTNGKTVFLGTIFKGFFKTDLSFQSIDSFPIDIPDIYISGSCIDKENNYWLTSSHGIFKYENNKKKHIDRSNGIPLDAINCVFQDKEGNMWFGSDGKGLLRFCGEGQLFYNQSTGFSSDLILATYKIPGDGYYFGSYDKGVFHLKNNNTIVSLNLPATSVWSIEKDGESYWFGTDAGLIKMTNKLIEPFPINDEFGLVRFVERLRNGKIYFAGDDGIGYINNGKPIVFDLNRRQITKMGSIRQLVLLNGKLIAGCSNGIFEIDVAKKRTILLKQFKSGVMTLQLDDLNRLWIGTENGLFNYDGIQFKNIRIGSKSGARFINFLEKIDDYMYIGTNNGLYIFDCNEQEILPFKHLGINSGLINLESNINSSYYDGKYLWFGTAEGLSRINVKSIVENNSIVFKPKIQLTQLLINFQKPGENDFTGKKNSFGVPISLRLPYNKNNITIDIDGILLHDPESVLFQYWLEGQDAGWSPATHNSTITLSNLTDGDYQLHIRAVDELGNLSDQMIVPIYIKAPIWRTWWFYTFIALLIALLIRYYFRWQIKQEREKNYKENLENKTRLLALEQQSLNASMNRHFIFNSLNSIQYFINTQDKLSANRYLTSFAKLIRKNLDSAAEGDNMVSLYQEMERLELYLSLESMRFKDRFTYKIECDDIDTEHVIVPAMLLQPFVENSIIHGILPIEERKGEIIISVKVIANQLEISIDDNGIGIEFSLNKKAQFQGDHKSQGMEITSKRISLIRTMLKKDYELIGPFQMMNSDGSIKGTRVLLKIPLENLEN